MNPSDLKLPAVDRSMFVSDVFLKREWVMDPPPFIIDRLQDDLIRKIYEIKMRHLAEMAKLEIKAKEIESAMFAEVAQAMATSK